MRALFPVLILFMLSAISREVVYGVHSGLLLSWMFTLGVRLTEFS